MSDVPFRLALLQSLTTLLQTITPANGYKTDLSSFTPTGGVLTPRVYRGRNVFGESDPLPMVSILDEPLPQVPMLDSPDNPYVASKYNVLIQGFVADDRVNPTDPAYVLAADIRQCLAKEKRRCARAPNFLLNMNKKVTCMDIGLGTIRPPENGISNKAFFWQVLTFDIVENTEDPYGWDQG